MSQKRNTEFEIILQLLRGPSHVRAISQNIHQPLATVSRKLSMLVQENILDFKTQGKNKIFSFKKNIQSKNHIYKAEHYKLIKATKLYPKLSVILNDILNKTNERVIILFGSYSNSTAKKDSDIDIYVETKNKEVKQIIKSINSKINVKMGPFDLDSNLIKEIIKNHIIIKGVEDFYERIKFFD